MKKLLFLIPFLIITKAFAFNEKDWAYIPISSYVAEATLGPVFFSSGPIQFIGVTVSSPAPNAWMTIFRSTSPVYYSKIATQTIIPADFPPSSPPSGFVPLHEMQNDSYTYISRNGTAKYTIWLRCPRKTPNVGGYNVCPGLQPLGE